MMRKFFWLSACVLVLLVTRIAPAEEANRLSPEELSEGWILLFDGETTFGWQASSDADWQVADGAITATKGTQGLLATTSDWSDYELKVDFRAAATTNAGIFLRTPVSPTDPAADCYEVNIAPWGSTPFATGSIVARQKCDKPHDSTDWQTYDITAVGDTITIKLGGETVLEYKDPKPLHRGRIGLQFNSGKIEYRNVKLRPLSLASIFNGKDLTGWTVYPGERSEFSVTPEGFLQVKKGRGQIESEGRYGDFVMQLEVRTNGRGLNSGIFFRNVPGQFWQGYESQIHNAFRKGDRTQPIDFGTGAIYRRQAARRVIPNDLEWFSKTIVASGDHLAVWVNGIQVTDWQDTRPTNSNPREGLRTEAGTLAIQGHDPGTNLWFRNLKIVELPAR